MRYCKLVLLALGRVVSSSAQKASLKFERQVAEDWMRSLQQTRLFSHQHAQTCLLNTKAYQYASCARHLPHPVVCRHAFPHVFNCPPQPRQSIARRMPGGADILIFQQWSRPGRTATLELDLKARPAAVLSRSTEFSKKLQSPKTMQGPSSAHFHD